MATIPATVTIMDLASGTLSSAALFEAQQTTGGVATTIATPLSQIASTILTSFLNGSAGLPLIGNGSALAPSFQALNLATSNVTGALQVVNGGIGTNALASHAVLLGNGTSALAVAVPTTAGWPLVSNNATADPSFQPLSLSSANVTGVLPVIDGGTGFSSYLASTILFATTATALAQDAALGWDNSLKILNLSLQSGASYSAETGTQINMTGADGFACTLFMTSFGSPCAIDLRHSGGTFAARTPPASGATMVQLNGQAYDGTAFAKSLRIRGQASETWNATSHGSDWLFFNTAIGTTNTSEKMRLYGDGTMRVLGPIIGSSAVTTMALAIGRQGTTNPAFQIDTSNATTVTGLKITAASAGGGVVVGVISSAANESLTVSALGSGTITLNATTGINLQGIQTSGQAATGYVAEYITVTGAATAVSNGVALSVATMTCSPGNYDVWGQVEYTGHTTTTVQYQLASISQTTNSRDIATGFSMLTTLQGAAVFNVVAFSGVQIGPFQKTFSATTTLYLIAQEGFAVSTSAAAGYIAARRRF